MKELIIALICGLSILSGQEQEKEEQKGGLAEGRWYFDSTGVKVYAVGYFQSYFLVSGEEKIGWFVFTRGNNKLEPPSIFVAGLSYIPSRYIGSEIGGGLNANPFDKFYYLRGRLWLGRDATTLYKGDLYYLDLAAEVGGHGFQNWEARFKIRVTPWFGFGFFAEKTKGLGPRLDIQPTEIPFSVSINALVVRWDTTERKLKQRDVIGGIFVRLIL